MKLSKRSILKYIFVTLVSPICLLILLFIALYLPPVQNWAVRVVSEYASEKTGMQISVKKVLLAFPLDLSLEGVECLRMDSLTNRYDTIMSVDKAVVSVRLLPLFNKDVEVAELELNNSIMNTVDLIPQARIKGHVGRLFMTGGSPVGKISLNASTADLQKILIDNAQLDIALKDTVIEDTTSSPIPWCVNAKELAISNSNLLLHMPNDSMQIGARIGEVKAGGISANLMKNEYGVNSLVAENTFITYDNVYEKKMPKGLDLNHMAFDIGRLKVDSICFLDPDLNLKIKECCIKERCGFEISSMAADISLKSNKLFVKGALNTPSSKLYTDTELDLSSFDGNDNGKFHVVIDASVSNADMMMIAENMLSSDIKRTIPMLPLKVKGEALGNMQNVNIPSLLIEMPTAFSINTSGSIQGMKYLTSDPYSEKFNANLHLDAKMKNMAFVKSFLDRSTAKMINIPPVDAIADIDIHGADYKVKLKAYEGKGSVTANTRIDVRQMKYLADVKANNLHLNHFVKGMGLGTFTGTINAKGKGFDFTDKSTLTDVKADIKRFQYDRYNLTNMKANVHLANGIADATIKSANQLVNGDIKLSALLNKKNIDATIATELSNLDLYKLHFVDVPLRLSLCGHIDFESDLDQFYKVNGLVSDIRITDSVETRHLDDIVLDVFTRKDTTAAHIYCGDFETKLNAQGGYKWLLGCSDRLMAVVDKQIKNRTIDQQELRNALPKMQLYMRCGRDNPVHNSITYWGIDFNDAYANINTSKEDGINGDMHLFGLKSQGYQLDTITVGLSSTNDPLNIAYKAHIQNEKPNDYVFDVFVDGKVLDHGISMNGAFYDENDVLGLKIGAEATMEAEGIKLHLTPNDPIIAYEAFEINDNNYILIGENNRVFADVKMRAQDGTGIQIYSTDDDSDYLQDITLSLNRLNLRKLLAAIPYAPKVEGQLDGDYHFIQSTDKSFSVSTDMVVHNMIYEGCSIGNLGTQLVYMPKDDGSHYVDGHILLEEEEVGTITGSYNFDTDAIDAKLDFMRFPIALVNGFIPDQIVGLEGYAEGELTVNGTTGKPNVEGELFLESAALISIPYGIRMRFDDDPVRIVNSKLLLENFQMYASNNSPLIAQGEIDFSNTEHINLNLRIKAENFLLIDAKENKKSEAYGKAFVNFYCFIRGELDKLRVRGKLDVLSSTNLFYILRDSPINTDNRLKELVTFTDFTSEEPISIVQPVIDGIDMDLSVNVNDGAHIKCWLNTDHSNYLDLIGGGALRMKYQNENIDLRGRYTIHEGEMKYSLPIIPLKTFTILPDSYVEFNGDMMNPKLNITATERTKASCNIDGVNRLVAFDCGVVITKTLNDMGLQFIIEAPEEQTIKDQLAMMSVEERGKIAVTMLTTGMYLADGNTSNFSMNSALNSFLQSEINQIAGNALKTLDVSFGLDNSTEEDGTRHTDYTFKFAKRFWNNKLAISVGGKISSGPDVSGQNKSFFDNVEAQYRFSETSNQYMNLFYKRSVYDFLEGYVGQYGAGYMYKKKLQRLSELFKKTQSTIPGPVLRQERKDSTISNK